MRAGLVLRARLFASLLLARENSGAKGEADAAAHYSLQGFGAGCAELGDTAVPPCTIAGFHPCDFTLEKGHGLSLWTASCPCLAMPVPLLQPTHPGWATKVGLCAVALV